MKSYPDYEKTRKKAKSATGVYNLIKEQQQEIATRNQQIDYVRSLHHKLKKKYYKETIFLVIALFTQIQNNKNA